MLWTVKSAGFSEENTKRILIEVGLYTGEKYEKIKLLTE